MNDSLERLSYRRQLCYRTVYNESPETNRNPKLNTVGQAFQPVQDSIKSLFHFN